MNKKIYMIICRTKNNEFKGYFIENQFTDYKTDSIIGLGISKFKPVIDEAKIYTILSDAIDDLISLKEIKSEYKVEIEEYDFKQKFN